MITFAPGPSKVFDQVGQYLQDAFQTGILSANHRSAAFMNLYQETETLFKEKLHVPEDYKLLFTSSATENWEIIAQSIVESSSFHIYSGSFGKKWYTFAQHLNEATGSHKLGTEDALDVAGLEIDGKHDLIAITQNETSNATEVSQELLGALGEKYPDKMIAVDTTSSMGGIALDFSLADIWFASVQKCFGLPAGLGVLILSPKAIAKCESKGESGRYNSLSFMLENAKIYQTHYTPNVLGVYLLKRSMEDHPEIQVTDALVRTRMKELETVIAQSKKLTMLVQNSETRSKTVMGIAGEELFIKEFKKAAEQAGMQMGSGYGPLKPTSFRIANFPAITEQEFENLLKFLKEY